MCPSRICHMFFSCFMVHFIEKKISFLSLCSFNHLFGVEGNINNSFVLSRRDDERQLQSKHVSLGPRRIMFPSILSYSSVLVLEFLFPPSKGISNLINSNVNHDNLIVMSPS